MGYYKKTMDWYAECIQSYQIKHQGNFMPYHSNVVVNFVHFHIYLLFLLLTSKKTHHLVYNAC